MARHMIVAQFHEYAAAHRALCELIQTGIRPNRISIVAGDRSNSHGANRDFGILKEDADIYIAIHEAKELPEKVPDYQVPHFHNTDEFYYFIGDHPDLTGLEGQIIFEGTVHKIFSPATVYIPTGAVHEYKVTRGAGTVTVLFRNRGYTHHDKQPDVAKGNQEANRFAGYIIKPEVRPLILKENAVKLLRLGGA